MQNEKCGMMNEEVMQVVCPIHGEPLEKSELTGDGKSLGYLWICPHTEWGSKEGECDYCLDSDVDGNPVVEESEVCDG